MTTHENALRWVNQQARVTARTAQGDRYATGRVIAYQQAPTVLIEMDDGERVSCPTGWRDRLRVVAGYTIDRLPLLSSVKCRYNITRQKSAQGSDLRHPA